MDFDEYDVFVLHFDGVLADTYTLHTRIAKNLLATFNLYVSDEFVHKYACLPFPFFYKQASEEYGVALPLDQLVKTHVTLFYRAIDKDELPLYPIIKALLYSKKRNIVFTSLTVDYMEVAFDAWNITSLISVYFGFHQPVVDFDQYLSSMFPTEELRMKVLCFDTLPVLLEKFDAAGFPTCAVKNDWNANCLMDDWPGIDVRPYSLASKESILLT